MSKLTPAEIQKEWDHRYEERLGSLCGGEIPTPEQMRIARYEADEWLKSYKGPKEDLFK